MTDFAFTIQRGDTREIELTLSGVATPLTGDEKLWFTAKLRDSDTDADAVFQKTMGDGIAVKDADAAVCTVQIDAADTDALARQTRLLCDVQLAVGSDVTTLASGAITVKPDITRSTS